MRACIGCVITSTEEEEADDEDESDGQKKEEAAVDVVEVADKTDPAQRVAIHLRRTTGYTHVTAAGSTPSFLRYSILALQAQFV